MAATGESLGLQPDEFAFYFQSREGIEASELGTFLKRAAAVAKNAGAEIRVVGIQNGSLAVIMNAIKKSRVAQAAANEFMEKPLDGTLKATKIVGGATAIVATVVTGIVLAMSPDPEVVDPMAKAGADVVQKQNVETIQIVTLNDTIIVMDEESAYQIRQFERQNRGRKKPPQLSYEMAMMVEDMRERHIAGSIVDIHGALFFSPDDAQFYVPVDMNRSEDADILEPDAHYLIRGELVIKNRQPHSVIIQRARRD